MQNTLDVVTKQLQLLRSPVPTLEHLVLVLSTGGARELRSRTLLKGHYTWGTRGGSEVNSHSGLLPDPPPFPGWGTKALNMSQATQQWQEREGEGEEEEGAYTTDIIKKHILTKRKVGVPVGGEMHRHPVKQVSGAGVW